MRLVAWLLGTTAAACCSQSLENARLRVEVASDASTVITDKATNARWDFERPGVLAEVTREGSLRGAVSREGDRIAFTVEPGVRFELRLRPEAVEYSCTPETDVREVSLLRDSPALEAGEGNYLAIPRKMGLLLPVEGDKPQVNRFQTYGDAGYTMAMFGAVRGGSALLVTWNDPYIDLITNYTVEPSPRLSASVVSVYRGPPEDGFVVVPGRLLTAGLAPPRAKRTVRLQPLGRGGYVEIAKAYREIARQRGFHKSTRDRLRENPSFEKLIGAADFKVFTFSRTVPNTRWNPTNEERTRVNYTLAQCAELAEHLHNDLGLDRALFVINGWVRKGYDNQHPDVLPAAAEIGGNEGLAACSRRVRELGWLFGLHDNYQNLYRDAPSWNESYIQKKADGSLFQRGVWAGGPAYIICSKEQLKFVDRNVPEIRRLFQPTAFFSDQLFAAPLYECFDRNHPLTRQGDIRYKLELCDRMRKAFGIFGTEDGQEWGVAHTDYFEGLMAQKTRYRQPDSTDIVIPLFELVYGDSIPIYTHQSDRPKPDNPTYILDHILYAEMPVYYFGAPRYWTGAGYVPEPGAETRLVFARGGRFGYIDQFIKNTYEVLSPLSRVTALLPMTDHRFLTPDRKVESSRFGSDVRITVNYGPGDYDAGVAALPQYGFLVESPELVAFHARAYRGIRYDDPPLIVLRSLDGQPIASSDRVRIYCGFGDCRAPWKGTTIKVETEKIVGRKGVL